MASWFCKIGGKTYGPYGGEDLRRLVVEGRLMPEDSLREGEDGEWFAADEMENLFPESALRRREGDGDRDDDDDLDRPRRRKKSGKPSNYYKVVGSNFFEGGQWKQLLVITFGLQILVPTLFFLIVLFVRAFEGHGRSIAAALGLLVLGALVGFILLAAAFAIDVLLFGLPCLAMRVRLNPRRDSVLDIFAFCYLLGLIPTLIRMITTCIDSSVAYYMVLIHPVFHFGAIVYLLISYWGLSPGRAWALGAIRFGYQMGAVVIFVLLAGGLLWLR